MHIEMRGGELYMGPRTEIRAKAIAHISGKLQLEEARGFSLRCVIHCASTIEVGKGAYIGAKATIAMGVEIGDFCRVGSNSLVLRSIEPHRLAVGVPARPIMKLE